MRTGFTRPFAVSQLYEVDSPLPICDAIGFAAPQRESAGTEIRPTLEEQAHYWSCTPGLVNEARCTAPFSYTHPTDPTLSVPAGM
jgi:hypothetical protein